MASVSYKLEGAEQVLKDLKTLPTKVSRGILRKALRAGAKVVLAAAKANAPRATGQLRRSLKVRVGKRKKDRISFLVQTRQGDYAGDEFYGAFQEFGWKTGKRRSSNRRQIPGKHYIERAYNATKTKAVETVMQVLRDGIDAEVRK